MNPSQEALVAVPIKYLQLMHPMDMTGLCALLLNKGTVEKWSEKQVMLALAYLSFSLTTPPAIYEKAKRPWLMTLMDHCTLELHGQEVFWWKQSKRTNSPLQEFWQFQQYTPAYITKQQRPLRW